MNTIKVGDIWYRFDTTLLVGNNSETTVSIKERQFVVIKLTKCGAWITEKFNENDGFIRGYDHMETRRRFVMVNNTKSYAYPTVERAKISFLFRKRKQISILKSKLDTAIVAFEKAANDWDIKGFYSRKTKTIL